MIGVEARHVPVLLKETIAFLDVRKGGTYVDCTAGFGGHAEAILRLLDGTGELLAFDRDPEALESIRERLGHFQNLQVFHENFKNLLEVLARCGIESLDGCLLDLGVSSHQLESPERGFSFLLEGPLDMRMDPRAPRTAADLVNALSEKELADIFWRYGEERQARKLAAAIARRRQEARFRTTAELAQLVEQVKGRRPGGIHPATQIFQALRIEVNQELAGLEEFLETIIGLLRSGGRLAVISFHSLEDRIVKRTFRREEGKCVCFRPRELCICPRLARVRALTRKPVTPGFEEIEGNPRARSAKLRAVEKL